MQIKTGSVTSTPGGVWVNPVIKLKLSTEFQKPKHYKTMQLTIAGYCCKKFLTMKLIVLLTCVACIHVSASSFGQTVSVSFNNSPIEKVFKEIQRQTGYSFIYTRTQLKQAKPVTVSAISEQLKEVLIKCFQNQPLTFIIEDKYIVVQSKPVVQTQAAAAIDVNGKVANEDGEPLPGVTITIKKSGKATSTNEKGEFVLTGVSDDDVLIITSVGYYKKEIAVSKRANFSITLKIEVSSLDETVVIAYGTTTKRYNTGSISKITAEEIAKQPVANPLATLQGRVPGLVVNSTSGLPGSSFTVQIRGQNSVNASPPTPSLPIRLDQPLFIIDGVPFAPQNIRINQFSSVAAPVGTELYNNPYGGYSPFSTLNTNDIESIEVLRDADATAIYGSRAANGVILITTKKGSIGKTKFSMNVYTGVSKVTRTMPMLNTEQYRSLRREAFNNDGITPTTTLIASNPAYAPDLMIFDSLRYTDWKEYFLGGTANTTDVNASLSGGTALTQFLIGAGFHRETYIFPGDFGSNRYSFKLNLQHNSSDKRLTLGFSASYVYEQNNSSASANVLQAFTLPPNYPALLDDNGNLIWEYKGVRLSDNPLGYLKQRYAVKNYNLISNLQVGYKLTKHISFRSSFGYNSFMGNEIAQFPKASQNPITNPQSRANFGTNNFQTWIVEPQAEYVRSFSKLKFTALVGATYQQNTNNSTQIIASNYTNDALLGSASAAGVKQVGDAFSQYRYIAGFGRVNVILNKKYIANLNGRRDGSSRFGPGKQFGNFGSIGLGWIFSEEKWISKGMPFLSFGKLRTSLGTTGDDGIGDYQFLPRWNLSGSSTGLSFLGGEAYLPVNLYNPDFSWSVTKKLEAGIELGFISNRIITNLTWYLNKSGNQLVSYRLASQAGGFDGVTANFPALVENRGWEMEVVSHNINSTAFKWTSAFNLTIPKNKLKAFPGIESSSYATIYRIGYSLSVLNKYVYTGLNDANGVYTFLDADRNGNINAQDFQPIGNLDPVFYGGLNNAFTWKGFQLDIFLDFRKQIGPNYLAQIYANYPAGSYGNLPAEFLNRWQQQGVNAELAKLTVRRYASQAGASALLFSRSSAAYSDASFIRFRTLAFSYTINENLLKRWRMTNCRFFLNAQNLFTITGYKGNDPETKSFYALPPLKTIVAGIQVTL